MRDAFRDVLCALALTLAPRDACAATVGVWLANQAIGYLLLEYPSERHDRPMGLVLGLSALSATFVGVMPCRPQSRPPPRSLPTGRATAWPRCSPPTSPLSRSTRA